MVRRFSNATTGPVKPRNRSEGQEKGLPGLLDNHFQNGLNVEKLKSESPTTNSWFDVAQVLGWEGEGEDWNEFKSRFADACGISLRNGPRVS